jgi:S-(hydroxymethyl)glutathione dehydrogenase / alcohol dehydrogenase
MKAAVLREVNAPMTIEDVTISKPRGREVLVRVEAVGLCHSDLHVIDGGWPNPLPCVLGHEVAGVVEQVGPEAHTVKPGDHVIVCLTFHCGHCGECHSGNSHRCLTPEAQRGADQPARLTRGDERLDQYMKIGGFAEQVLVHESGVVPIRRDVGLDKVCLIGCGVTTGFGAVINTAKVRPGETVVIIGCGGVGLAAVNGAAVAGAGRIVAVDRVAGKLDMARQFGATDVIDASTTDVAAAMKELTGGLGVPHAIEAIGRKDTIELAYRILGKGGRATIIGMTPPDLKIEISAASLLREQGIQGSLMGGVRNSIDIPRYVDLYMDGRLKLDQLVSRTRPLTEINEGFADMKAAEIARTVVTFE